MNKKLKQMKLKLRKADGNMALIALAVAVILIIGMYLLSSNVGGGLGKTTNNLNTAVTDKQFDTNFVTP